MARRWFKRLLPAMVALGIVLIGVLGLAAIAPAQTLPSLNSRLTRLESQVITLRSQINRLDNQLARTGRNPTGGNAPQQPEAIAPAVDETQFDRLATLLIETIDRVSALEARLAALDGMPGGQ